MSDNTILPITPPENVVSKSYFSSYEKDILCFSPFINIFLECLELDRQSIISDIKEKIDELINKEIKIDEYISFLFLDIEKNFINEASMP